MLFVIRECSIDVVAEFVVVSPPGILFQFGHMEEQRIDLHRRTQQAEPDPKFGTSLGTSRALSANREPD
jgi:hypothetical protein